MPDRYYTQRIPINDAGTQHVTMIVLDTNPCIKDYRGDSPLYWDPPISEAPHFHENIINQTCTPQLEWFKDQLSQVPEDDWLFVMGHHPIEQVDVEDFLTPLQDANIDLYLCGHEHLLRQYTLNDGPTHYVVSGAGCMIHLDSIDKAAQRTAQVAARHKRLTEMRSGLSVEPDKVWEGSYAGFTIHTFSDDLQTLTTTFYDNNVKHLHDFNTTKQQRSA